jgi:hypothetical protein
MQSTSSASLCVVNKYVTYHYICNLKQAYLKEYITFVSKHTLKKIGAKNGAKGAEMREQFSSLPWTVSGHYSAQDVMMWPMCSHY